MEPNKQDEGKSTPARGRARSRLTSRSAIVAGADSPERAVVPPVGEQALPASAEITVPSPTPPTSARADDPQSGLSSHVKLEHLSIGGGGEQAASNVPLPSWYSYRITRPATLVAKQSSPKSSVPLSLVTNYFEASVASTWSIHQYTVTFDPPLEDEDTIQRKGIFRNFAQQLEPCLFDGVMLFTIAEIPQLPTVLATMDKRTNNPITITIDCHKAVDRKDPTCFQIYNIFVRKCLEHCALVQMGRRYFDKNLGEELRQYSLEVWPGFVTSLRYFEKSLLLNVELVSKVIKKKNTYEVMDEARRNYNGRDTSEEAIRKFIATEVVGRTLMTPYNNHTYPIQEILWDEHPTDTFPRRDGSEMDYLTYYQNKYGIKIRYPNQPLLLVAPKEKELRKGNFKPVKLVPETCVVTGLTEAMRNNFTLMLELGKITHVKPAQRVLKIENFLKRFCGNEKIEQEMKKWGIHLDKTKLVQIQGKKLKEETIEQQGKTFNYADFCNAKNVREKLHEPSEMRDWVLITPKRQQPDIAEFLKVLKRVTTSMGFRIGDPTILVVDTPHSHGSAYMDKIENVVNEKRGKIALIFIVLPNNNSDLYSLLKQQLTAKWGIPSQCCLPKNLKDRTNRPNMSILSKIGVQLCCKVGGVPWIIKNPYAKRQVCVMGFDVYHSGSIGGISYGAIVATINKEFSKSCSFVSRHKHREEISTKMGSQITKCLEEYYKTNGCLPEKIFFYRDGVGEGQVDIVYESEVGSAVEAISNICKAKGMKEEDRPKLTFIIVSKRINTRFMVKSGDTYTNPPAGTVVDDVVTLHYRYDFFLVSVAGDDRKQQGTVSPTSYNVIYDENAMSPENMQTLSFKLCHNYYNWNGSVSVPSVCQNAHKLAYITGEYIKQTCKENLRYLPFYL